MAESYISSPLPVSGIVTLGAADVATEFVLPPRAAVMAVKFNSDDGKLAYTGTDGAAIDASYVVVSPDQWTVIYRNPLAPQSGNMRTSVFLATAAGGSDVDVVVGSDLSAGNALPTGAATAANQATQITAEQAVQAALELGGYTGARLLAVQTALEAGGSLYLLNDAVKTALEAGGALYLLNDAVKTALEAGGYSGSRLEAIKASLEAAGALYVVNDAIKTTLEAGGASYLLLDAIKTSVETGGNLVAAVADIEADLGTLKRVALKSGTVANYAGVEIEVTGLTASAPHRLLGLAYRLTGGTGGNTTTPSFGEVSGFTTGDANTRRTSAALVLGAAVTVEVFTQPIPFWSDADGKAFIKGASPAVADSSLFWRADIAEDRSA